VSIAVKAQHGKRNASEIFSNLLLNQETLFYNKAAYCEYHFFFIAGDFLSFVAISWDQERSSHSSRLLCQLCIPLSSVFRYTFSWILGGEERKTCNFQCALLAMI